jgi:hypothetical protein
MPLAEPESFVSSNAPNRFFKQHHEVEAPQVDERAFRPAWRIRTQIDKLALEGKITGFEWRVAGWLRSCYERGYGSDLRSTLPQLGMAGRGSHHWRRENPEGRKAQAREYLHHVEQVMGPIVYPIVIAVVVEDVPWRELGTRYGVHAKTAKAWAIEAVKALAGV